MPIDEALCPSQAKLHFSYVQNRILDLREEGQGGAGCAARVALQGWQLFLVLTLSRASNVVPILFSRWIPGLQFPPFRLLYRQLPRLS